MHCLHCAHPHYVFYSTSHVFNATVAKPSNGSQTLQHGKNPALKQQAFQLYLDGMSMRDIGRMFSSSQDDISLARSSCPSTPSKLTIDPSLLLRRNR